MQAAASRIGFHATEEDVDSGTVNEPQNYMDSFCLSRIQLPSLLRRRASKQLLCNTAA